MNIVSTIKTLTTAYNTGAAERLSGLPPKYAEQSLQKQEQIDKMGLITMWEYKKTGKGLC